MAFIILGWEEALKTKPKNSLIHVRMSDPSQDGPASFLFRSLCTYLHTTIITNEITLTSMDHELKKPFT